MPTTLSGRLKERYINRLLIQDIRKNVRSFPTNTDRPVTLPSAGYQANNKLGLLTRKDGQPSPPLEHKPHEVTVGKMHRDDEYHG